MEKPRWLWQQENSTATTATNLLDLTVKQTLDTLLAIQMRLELATGVPVAIFGPTGQQLPGISPPLSRSSEQHVPPAREVLAADQWPQHNGQLLAVTWGTNLHFFVTPVVVSDHTIAQVVLGPLQVFDPGKQDELADRCMPPRAKTIVGVPVLASWRAHAIAETATIIVSLYNNQRSMEIENRRQSMLRPPAREEATLVLPAIAQTGQHAHVGRHPEESAARLSSLAESARLPEHSDASALTDGQASSLTTAQERMKLLGALLEAMPQAVVISSAPSGQIILANRAACTLWPDLLGEPGSSPASSSKRILLEDYPPIWTGLHQALLQGAALYQGEESIEPPAQQEAKTTNRRPQSAPPLALEGNTGNSRNSDGAVFSPHTQGQTARLPLLVSAFPLRDASGEVAYAVATFEDVRTLVEREGFKDDLVMRTTHDARNPLTIITSAAQLLERTLGEEGSPGATLERERRWLADIQTQARLLTDLTEQLALLIHLQDAQHSPRSEPLNLVRLVQQTIGNQLSLTPERQIETTFEVDSCLVQGNTLQLEHILKHALKNAVKYSRPDTTISVIVRHLPERAPLWAEISVRDQGVGIPRACLPHLFERLYQVPETQERRLLTAHAQSSRAEIGQGMSLYLCKQLLEHLGGQIWVESVEGQGTTVKLMLPLKK
jgi:signal transduction histidine kinase/PAS domain-containing protein